MRTTPELPEQVRDAAAEAESRAAIVDVPAAGSRAAPTPPAAAEVDAALDDRPPLRLGSVAAAGGLTAAAAAWAVGGLMRDQVVPRAAGMAGVAIGAGLVALSFRRGSRGLVQYAVLPLAALVGALLTMPAATGGAADLPGLVGEALKGGGLLQPPIPNQPGWRFILVMLFAVVAAGAVSAAALWHRAKLAILVPLPLVVGATLIQPKGNELSSSMVSSLMVLGGLAFAYGSELRTDAGGTRGFEARRLARGAAMLAGLVVLGVIVTRLGILFPGSQYDPVVPPQKPVASPPVADRELFRVLSGASEGPWRLGVLDSYDGQDWWLPPRDPHRLVAVDPNSGRVLPDAPRVPADRQIKVQIETRDLGGLSLPVPGEMIGLTSSSGGTVDYDPRTQMPTLGERVPQGYRYTVTYTQPPSTASLENAVAPPADISATYLNVPPPPALVRAALLKAPTNPYDRLQYLRTELFNNVVLAGIGQPGPIGVERVAAMLRVGTTASPYEVAAAEATVARWAGVPSRIGFGYDGGQHVASGLSVHPRDARFWLEVYFGGTGWVPLVGQPVHAQSSFSKADKKQDAKVKPSDQLALIIYVPTEEPNPLALWEVIRYWLFRGLLVVALLLLVRFGYPVLCKRVRSSMRQRWGVRHGPVGRTLVAYSDFRDLCHDRNVGAAGDTPLLFTSAFTHDAEHLELAWLVTRLLWGDLRRDIRSDDAAAAERIVESLRERLLKSQTAVNRFLGTVSRASLRDPYSPQVPNFYPRLRLHRPSWRLPRPGLPGMRRLRPSAAVGTAAALLCAILLSSCGSAEAAAPGHAVRLPSHDAPADGVVVLGYSFRREPKAEGEFRQAGSSSLVSTGTVHSIKKADATEGYLENALLRPDVDSADPAVQRQLRDGVGSAFAIRHFGDTTVYVETVSAQRIYLWFPAQWNVMELMVVRQTVADPDHLVLALMAFQRGIDIDRVLPTGAST